MTEILFARKTDVDSLIISVAAANGAVRFDVAQTLTTPQITQALANLGGTTGTGTIVRSVSPVLTGNVGIGTTSTISLDINNNANAASVPAPVANSQLRIAGPDGGFPVVSFDGFGGFGSFQYRRANGTAAVKTGVVANDVLGNFAFEGYTNGAVYGTFGAVIRGLAVETWTPTANGGAIDFRVVNAGTVTATSVLTITGASGSGRVGIGTETNPQQPVVISQNVTTGLTGSAATPLLRIVSADGLNSALELIAYTNASVINLAAIPNFFFVSGGGTAAAPSGTKAGQNLGQFGWRGMTATPAFSSSVAKIAGFASEDYLAGSTNLGSYISFSTTAPAVGLTVLEQMRLQPSGGLTLGTSIVATDPGAGNLLVQGKIGAGTVVPDALLTANANTAQSVAPTAGTNVHIVGADATANRITMNSYGTFSALNASHAMGTQASKTVSVAGNIMFSFGAAGWNGSAYQTSSAIAFTAGETFSGTASGGYVSFFTVPLTTIVTAETVRFQPSGGVSIGSTAVATDPGLGNLLVQNFINTGGDTRVTSDFTVTSSTTPVAITGLQVTLIAGQTYGFLGRLYTTGAAAGGVNIAMNGTATVTNFIAEMVAFSGVSVYGQGRVTTLNTAAITNAAAGSPLVDISGTFTVNAGGTFGPTFAQATSNVTGSVVKRGSWFRVWLMT